MLYPTSHPKALQTPADRAQRLIGLAASLPATVEAAMLQSFPHRRTAKARSIVEQLITVLYEQLRDDYHAAGSPFWSRRNRPRSVDLLARGIAPLLELVSGACASCLHCPSARGNG